MIDMASQSQDHWVLVRWPAEPPLQLLFSHTGRPSHSSKNPREVGYARQKQDEPQLRP